MNSVRFNNAITKLYTAFQNDSLIPECSCQCAVGTILDGKDYWKHFSDDHGSYKLNYVGLVNEKFGKRFNGYSPNELLQIEVAFLRGCGYQLPYHYKHDKPKKLSKDILFDGLSEALTVLCKLDNIPLMQIDLNQISTTQLLQH